MAHAAHTERRVALVIGNSNYANVARLPNPVKDAGAIADALARLGFDVSHAHNLGVDAMRKALAAFEDKANGADWALVYYSGHGMEIDGKNWLVPVDASFAKPEPAIAWAHSRSSRQAYSPPDGGQKCPVPSFNRSEV